MRKVKLVISLFVVLAVLAMALPIAASASTEGRRNTALGLAAGTVIAALTGKTVPALALGAGTLYAWNQYSTAHRRDVQRQNYWNNRYGYGRNPYYAPQPRWDRDARNNWSRDRDSRYDRDSSRDCYAGTSNWGRNRR